MKLCDEDLTLVRQSPFFDSAWYLVQYPDVAAQGLDPADHYLRYGAAEGRNPGPLFDTHDYATHWTAVASGEINPLVHFAHWLMSESIDQRDIWLLRGSALFDAAWYYVSYPDVAEASIDAVEHYLKFGAEEGRDPGPRFSTHDYVLNRPDVAAAKLNPLVHFLRHGITEDETVLAVSNMGVAEQVPKTVQAFVEETLPRKLGRKAVFVTHDFNIGGAPMLLKFIAQWFQHSTDYDVHVVAMANGPLSEDFVCFAPVHIVGGLTIADEDVPAIRDRLREFIGEEPAFTFINSAAAGHYCKIDPFNAPTFGYIHELRQVLDIVDDQFHVLMGRAGHVFCGASAVYDTVVRTYPNRREQLSTRPSFIPKSDYDQLLLPTHKAKLRRQLGLVENRKLVIGCGVAHWRKQPLVFVRIAARLIQDRGLEVDFAWVGNGEDIPDMVRLSEELGIADRLHLLGHRDDIRELFAAADIFALTSSEDPFPIVCLEAGAASTPVVAFREATGFSDVIDAPGQQVGGAVVPLGDEDAFCDALEAFLIDEERCIRAADALRVRVSAEFIQDVACMELLLRIREVAHLPPRVSIVVPSYNSAPYLAARLESINAQRLRDIELLLLDDGSQDESPRMLAEFALHRPEARLMLAAQNGGGVFKAWERGIREASGDFIWIAEADDSCEATFLNLMIQSFEKSGTHLVHGRSIPIDEDGKILGDWNDLYLDNIVHGGWRSSFSSPAAREVNRSLGRANTITNASGVLVRREAAQKAINVAVRFRLAGDWAFYLVAVHGGRIGYCHEAINYHRRHTNTVTASIEGSDLYFQELSDVGAVVHTLYGPDKERDVAFQHHLGREVQRFGYVGQLPKGVVRGGLTAPAPGLLMGVGDLSGGGAQMFAARLVNKWVERNSAAVLFVAGYEPEHAAVREKINPLVPVVGPADIEEEGGLAALLRGYGLDVILTGHWWADKAIGLYLDAEYIQQPWTVVMHGCYESVLAAADQFPDLLETLDRAERHSQGWIWTAPKNLQLFEEGHVAPRRVCHIVNGFESVPSSRIERSQFGLPEDALIFTLASRAIVEKGWYVALEAFQQVRARWHGHRDIQLQLIGDGPVATELRKGQKIEGVHLVPHTGRLADYISVSDVCLLPSWFAGESLPLVLIEFLAQGKPAIVSDIGMCGWAIDEHENGGPAGFILARDGEDGNVPVDALVAAMDRFAEDPSLALKLEAPALAAACKFNLDIMADKYQEFFEEVIAAAPLGAVAGLV